MSQEKKTAYELIRQSQLNVQDTSSLFKEQKVTRCPVCDKKKNFFNSICTEVAEAANCSDNPINIRKNGKE